MGEFGNGKAKLKMACFPQGRGRWDPLFRGRKAKEDGGFEELGDCVEQLLWSEVRRLDVDASKNRVMGWLLSPRKDSVEVPSTSECNLTWR